MNSELIGTLAALEKEKGIRKQVMIEAIEASLITAYKQNFDKCENVKVTVDPETGDFGVFALKTVVEQVAEPNLEISLEDARKHNIAAELGDTVEVEIQSKSFGRIAAQKAKNVILQTIREEERRVIYNQYFEKEHDIITGIVQRINGKNISIKLDDRLDTVLMANEQVPGEVFQPTERVKLYIVEVKEAARGPRIVVSRSHPELVRRLFEAEVSEVRDGTVEIRAIAREAGSRTKMAVWSNNPNVDAVGACVGVNGSRVGSVVQELRGEKIDIINWSDSPAVLIENALSPAKVISVMADDEEKSAEVVVPDYQLSLAIGKEGQNARLAARLTGFRIDIKSESQVQFDYDYEEEEYPEDGYADDDYAEEGYSDDGYAGDIYDENGYPQDDYAGGDYPEDAYAGEGYADPDGNDTDD
ncbi:MAG: transcription termination factor NusA [Lachnospiraceae bacterium]|nr:transcription termination factor NusA [Lachnospiraceae bacterium]